MEAKSTMTQPQQKIKVKKAKKPKLTKAEKKILKLKAAEELKKKLLRDHLTREIEMTNKSLKRGLSTWETLCKGIKITEMQEEVKAWTIKAVDIFERKEELIQRQLKDLDMTEDMHYRGFSRHSDILDYLLNTFNALKQTSKILYELQVSEVIEDFYQEFVEKQEVHTANLNNCENIVYSSQVYAENEFPMDFQNFLGRQFDVVNTEIERRHILRNQIVKKMETLLSQLRTFIEILQNDPGKPRNEETFNVLRERQRFHALNSAKMNEEERKTRKKLHGLQRQLLMFEINTNSSLHNLKLERKLFTNLRSKIQNQIEMDQERNKDFMKIVANETFLVIKKLNKIQIYGEQILGLAACCRKYQTQKEKILPFGDDIKSDSNEDEGDEYMFEVMAIDLSKHFDISEEHLRDQIFLLKNFWKRVSLVKTQNLLLIEEKQKLTDENEQYREIIRSMKKTVNIDQMLEGLTVIPIGLPNERKLK